MALGIDEFILGGGEVVRPLLHCKRVACSKGVGVRTDMYALLRSPM